MRSKRRILAANMEFMINNINGDIMKRILFVCHGNICRSASAEYMFKHMIKQRHLENKIYCESMAVSSEELGNDIYEPMRPYLVKRGIPLTRHHARQIQRKDYDNWDLILLFDESNRRIINRMMDDSQHKIYLLTEYVGMDGVIEDPWYTWKFDECLDEIQQALNLLIKKIME